MQNASKHAQGATRVDVELRLDGDLQFEISDDGGGFAYDEATRGSGITGMRDRLAAVGGELAVESSPGHGTRVFGRVPVE